MAKYSTTKSYGKWSDGYYKGSTYNTKYGNSSFWMDDDIITKFESGSTVDHIKLASYLRAISNFVRILTKDEKIKVRFSTKDHSYTDGKTVTISSKIDTGEFDTTVGLALHEAAHCVLTNFNSVNNHMFDNSGTASRINKFEAYEDAKLFKDLVNIIEDRRIDYYVMTNAPGYYGYYTALYNTYFNAKEIDKALENNEWYQETVEHYLNHICNFTNPGRQLDALKQLRNIWNVIDLGKINRLKSTDDVCQVAEKVFDIIKAATKVDKPADPGNASNPTKEDDSADNEKDNQGNVSNDINNSGSGIGADINEDIEGDQSDSDSDAAPSGPIKELSDAQKNRLKKAIERQRDFTNGEVKKKNMKSADADRIEEVAQSNTTLHDVNLKEHGGSVDPIEVVVLRGMDDKLLNNNDLVGSQYSTYDSLRNNEAVEAGWQLGTLLGRKLKTRDEERSLKTTRLDSGRIDKRLIAELGFGNEKVFSQIFNKTVRKSTIHISLDASGSMGGNKWSSAIKTAVAIGRACSMVSNIRVVIDVRGQTNGNYSRRGGSTARALVWVVYDSAKDSTVVLRTKFKRLYAGGSTPEGLCFDAIMKEILSTSKDSDTYFINVSDGEPAWNGYYGDIAERHTRSMMEKMRNNNITLLSYFATDRDKTRALQTSSWVSFKSMYGKEAVLIDTNDFNALSRSVNEMFVRKLD